MVLGTVSGVAVAAGTTDIAVSPAENTLAPGETTEVTVALSSADGGVGSADLRVETSDASVVTIQDVTVEADAAYQNVRGDQTGQNINFAAASTQDDTGEVVFLTATVEAVAEGTANIDVVGNPEDAVNGVAVGDEAGSSYTIDDIGSAALTVEGANEQPTADAGADQTVDEGDEVTLDASGSSDPDGDSLSYVWSETTSSGVTLDDDTSATPSFTAPDVESETTLNFEVEVSDGTATDTDSVNVTVQPVNEEPAASFSFSPDSPEASEQVSFNASDSNDPDGSIASYEWDFDDGDTAQDETATHTFDSPGDYDVTLTVTDDDGATAQTTQTVSVSEAPDPANFQVSNLNAPASATQGDNITVSADVTNDGDEEATQTVQFRLDVGDDGFGDAGDVVLSQDVELDPEESTTVEFTDIDTSELAPGDYTHGVVTDDDSATATISINEEPTASETSVSLSPESSEVVVGEVETYDVVVDNADGGVGAYELTVSLDDSSVASITDVELGGGPDAQTQNVTFADDGSSVTVSAALADTSDTGSVTIASVTVEGVAEGSSDLSVDVQALGNEEGDSYTVTEENGASISVVDLPPVGDFPNPPTDPDDDGLYEDVNGDGKFNIVDVQALFANLDDETVQNYPDAYDFNGDGSVDVVDVQKLYNEVLS
jgi:PKD repeat protein